MALPGAEGNMRGRPAGEEEVCDVHPRRRPPACHRCLDAAICSPQEHGSSTRPGLPNRHLHSLRTPLVARTPPPPCAAMCVPRLLRARRGGRAARTSCWTSSKAWGSSATPPHRLVGWLKKQANATDCVQQRCPSMHVTLRNRQTGVPPPRCRSPRSPSVAAAHKSPPPLVPSCACRTHLSFPSFLFMHPALPHLPLPLANTFCPPPPPLHSWWSRVRSAAAPPPRSAGPAAWPSASSARSSATGR